jgi:hypothetical protein
MRKLSAKLVPKCQKVEKKRQRLQSEQRLELCSPRDPNDFLSLLATVDETSFCHYAPETDRKEQSVEWQHNGSPRPKKFRVQKSVGKFLASNFLGIKTVSSALIIFQRSQILPLSITHICW